MHAAAGPRSPAAWPSSLLTERYQSRAAGGGGAPPPELHRCSASCPEADALRRKQQQEAQEEERRKQQHQSCSSTQAPSGRRTADPHSPGRPCRAKQQRTAADGGGGGGDPGNEPGQRTSCHPGQRPLRSYRTSSFSSLPAFTAALLPLLLALLMLPLVPPAAAACPPMPTLSPNTTQRCTWEYDQTLCQLTLWCLKCGSPPQLVFTALNIDDCSSQGSSYVDINCAGFAVVAARAAQPPAGASFTSSATARAAGAAGLDTSIPAAQSPVTAVSATVTALSAGTTARAALSTGAAVCPWHGRSLSSSGAARTPAGASRPSRPTAFAAVTASAASIPYTTHAADAAAGSSIPANAAVAGSFTSISAYPALTSTCSAITSSRSAGAAPIPSFPSTPPCPTAFAAVSASTTPFRAWHYPAPTAKATCTPAAAAGTSFSSLASRPTAVTALPAISLTSSPNPADSAITTPCAAIAPRAAAPGTRDDPPAATVCPWHDHPTAAARTSRAAAGTARTPAQASQPTGPLAPGLPQPALPAPAREPPGSPPLAWHDQPSDTSGRRPPILRPPSPPPRPPMPLPIPYQIRQGYQLQIGYAIPQRLTNTTQADLEKQISSQLSIPVDDVDITVTGNYISAVYMLRYIPDPMHPQCDLSTSIAMCATLCVQLSLSNCSQVVCECVSGYMERIPFFPHAPATPASSNPFSSHRRHVLSDAQHEAQHGADLDLDPVLGHATESLAQHGRHLAQGQVQEYVVTEMATQFVLVDGQTNTADFLNKIFNQPIYMDSWQVTNPTAGNVTLSSSFNITVRNPDGSDTPVLTVVDSDLTADIVKVTGLSTDLVLIEIPGEVVAIPQPEKDCPSPQLGVLCGADAVGAIVGIALGGVVVLGLLLMAVLYARRGRMAKVVVMDDFAWARKYAHIVPTNVIASPYVTQYGNPAANTNVYG
ncbi:hypothetical protein HYH03_006074 [Edaphochlamys debaryana]|uniref:Uncharacterized protein n=1 Tax=Edaphochlamys debaryana TaxID=47281 RepID=A0A836C0K5_9CHLO|nr:hypothetical protein HYH03_006074 [Edaphochlamys debaryana]|eukprot:KAG2495835.1 hypothetical protein HYH03_006074 [Edaphochlamys debaryana]